MVIESEKTEHPWYRTGLALFSALVLAMAFPPINLSLLVLIGLIPLFEALRGQTSRKGFTLGFQFGLLFCGSQLWFIGLLTYKWTGNVAVSIIPAVLATLIMSLYFGLFGAVAAKLAAKNWWALPILWFAIEVFRSFIPMLAFPWALIAEPLWIFGPLVNGAYFITIFGVGAWVVVINLLVWKGLEKTPWYEVRKWAFAALALPILSLIRFSMTEETRPLVVTAGQLGTDLAFGDRRDEPIRVARAANEIIDRAEVQGSQLLVLPEGMIQAAESWPPPIPFRVPTSLPIMFGGRRGANPQYQSIFAFDGKWSFVDKTRLVVFGEYFPFRDQISFIEALKLPATDVSPGLEEVKPVILNNIKIGPMICFEALFPDLGYRQKFKGAQLLTVHSIDDWFLDSPAMESLKAASVWRSIETGLPLVRSASMGYSFVTDSHGRIVTIGPLRENLALRAEISIRARP